MAERRVVLVTGCSSGIGRSIARHLSQVGYDVVAGVRRESDAELVQSDHDGITAVRLDVTDSQAIARAVEMVSRRWPDGIHGLINNAGVAVAGPLELVPIDQWRRQYEVNVLGIVQVTQAFLPLVRKSRGRIICIGSAASNLALPMVGAYASSKFAVAGLTDSLRRELAPHGVRVIVVHPGQTATPIFDRSEQEVVGRMEAICDDRGYAGTMKRLQQLMRQTERSRRSPDSVAKVVVKAMQSRRPRRRYDVGWDAKGAGLVHRIIPAGLVDWVVARKLQSAAGMSE